MIAALYIDPTGPYPGIANVDAWDVARDATTYQGPHPIVAHPPCGPWGRFAWACTKQDPALALLAVEQVRRWGGVLEHPYDSKLWPAVNLPYPGDLGLKDSAGGWSLEVFQGDWGHMAPKRTWLYFVGVSRELVLNALPPRLPPPPGRVEFTSARRRRVSPPRFAAWLVGLARQAVQP